MSVKPPAPAAPDPPVQGGVQSVAVGPKSFKPLNGGGAIVSKKKKQVAVGTTVTYVLSAPATTTFSVEKAAKGRKVGKSCKKQTAKNRKLKKCTLYKAVNGSFTHAGAAGQKKLKFSGRVNNKALKPGSYRLVATIGPTVKRAGFKIVR